MKRNGHVSCMLVLYLVAVTWLLPTVQSLTAGCVGAMISHQGQNQKQVPADVSREVMKRLKFNRERATSMRLQSSDGSSKSFKELPLETILWVGNSYGVRELLDGIEYGKVDDSPMHWHATDYITFFDRDVELLRIQFAEGSIMKFRESGHEYQFSLTEKSAEKVCDWFRRCGYGVFDRKRKSRIFEAAKSQQRFIDYPENVHADLLELTNSSTKQIKRRKLANTITAALGSPREAILLIWRSHGNRTSSWHSMSDNEELLLNCFTEEQILDATSQLANDRRAAFGASAYFFWPKISPEKNAKERPPLPNSVWLTIADVALNSAIELSDKSRILRVLEEIPGKEIDDFLVDVFYGRRGAIPDWSSSESWQEDPAIAEASAMILASRGNSSIKSEVQRRLKWPHPLPERASLEIALALLGEPQYLKEQQIKIRSSIISECFLKAIDRGEGRYGIDLLFGPALDPLSGAQNSSVDARCRKVIETYWPNGQSVVRKFKTYEDLPNWYKANGKQLKQIIADQQKKK